MNENEKVNIENTCEGDCKCGCGEEITTDEGFECGCGCEDESSTSEGCGCGGNSEEEKTCCSDDVEQEPKETCEKVEDEDLNTRYLRLMADFQNFKKRAEKQRGEIHAYANEKIVTKLLEVMDNFERALNHDDNSDGFKEGMELIFVQLKDVLTNSGVSEIETEGAEFDPNFHNAVMMEDSDDHSSGEISAVLQKGYTLNGKVIRPSMVKVAK